VKALAAIASWKSDPKTLLLACLSNRFPSLTDPTIYGTGTDLEAFGLAICEIPAYCRFAPTRVNLTIFLAIPERSPDLIHSSLIGHEKKGGGPRKINRPPISQA